VHRAYLLPVRRHHRDALLEHLIGNWKPLVQEL
jgi:hypothetical protein